MSDIMDLSNNLVETMNSHLLAQEYSEVIELFKNEKSSECIRNNSWDIVPKLSKYLTQYNVDECFELYQCSKTLLEIIGLVANPEEALLEFIEEAEDTTNDIKFIVMINLMKTVLFKITSKRDMSLEWCLNVIQHHLTALPRPIYEPSDSVKNFENSVPNSNADITRLIPIFEAVFNFYCPFVDEVESGLDNKNKRVLLISHILQTLGKCFPYVNFEDGVSLTRIQRMCYDFVNLLLKLKCEPLFFLPYIQPYSGISKEGEKNEYSENSEEIHDINDNVFARMREIPSVGFGVFFYVVIADGNFDFEYNYIVYKPKYIFEVLINVVASLMEKEHECSDYKGLELLKALVSLLNEPLLQKDLFYTVHRALLLSINRIMIYSDVPKNRKLAADLYKKYIKSFDVRGQYSLVLNLRKCIIHEATVGYVITIIKDLTMAFIQNPNICTERNYFNGKLFFDLIKIYCFISFEVATDLVHQSNVVISSLNFFRFLILGDKENLTGFKGYLNEITDKFLEPVKQAITSSRTHYELMMKSQNENQTMSSTPLNSEINVTSSCLTAINLIDSLLCRLMECMNDF